MLRWCDTHQELVLYRGHCFVHVAQVLRVQGRWTEALAEARQACDHLAGPVPSAMAAAACLEGDLLRLLDDLDAAEAAYARANDLGHQPQPGLSLLHLVRGDVAGADAMIRRALAEAEGPVFRSWLVPAAVDIALAAGNADAARDAVDELRVIAGELKSTMLKAHAALGSGAVLLHGDDPTAALVELRRALTTFTELDAREEGARTRLVIAQACRELGDTATADLESSAAKAALAMCREPEGRDGVDSAALPGGLTQREVDVLLLLARGNTNRAIGQELFISEKTVASHVSHIFTKLGVTSRSAATAYAYDNGLV